MPDADQDPRVLVVEDELLLRWFIRDALEEGGFKIEEADNVHQAMKMLEANGYQAVVTDIEMLVELNGVGLAWAVEAKAWELLR